MDICYISHEELGRFTNYHIPLNHAHHHHLQPSEAFELVRMDMVRVVDGLPFAIVDQDSNDRIWLYVRSGGGPKVRQLVRRR